MTQWYGNYRFAKDEGTVFNPDMVLRFMERYISNQELPENELILNMNLDYIRNDLSMATLENQEFVNLLSNIVNEESVSRKIRKRFTA